MERVEGCIFGVGDLVRLRGNPHKSLVVAAVTLAVEELPRESGSDPEAPAPTRERTVVIVAFFTSSDFKSVALRPEMLVMKKTLEEQIAEEEELAVELAARKPRAKKGRLLDDEEEVCDDFDEDEDEDDE